MKVRSSIFAVAVAVMILPTALGVTTPLQLVQATTITIGVAASCEDGHAVFKITNKGLEWPTVAKFSVYRIKGNTLVSQRRMRFTAGQQASFRVKAGGGGDQVELGIFIEPEWHAREMKFDGKVAC